MGARYFDADYVLHCLQTILSNSQISDEFSLNIFLFMRPSCFIISLNSFCNQTDKSIIHSLLIAVSLIFTKHLTKSINE